jgi:hypothetical protein
LAEIFHETLFIKTLRLIPSCCKISPGFFQREELRLKTTALSPCLKIFYLESPSVNDIDVAVVACCGDHSTKTADRQQPPVIKLTFSRIQT